MDTQPSAVWSYLQTGEATDGLNTDLLDSIREAVTNSDHALANELLEGLSLSDRREVRIFFNPILRDREKEWTGHGINRTFRFWTENQKREYLQFTHDVLEVLHANYDAAFGYGSVLSIVRDQTLIPHDDDLDLIVCVDAAKVSSYNNELKKMGDFLVDAGFSIRGDYPAHRHVSNGRFLLDVFLGMKEGDYVSWHPGPRRKLLFTDVFPPTKATLYGIDCLVPRDCETYLSAVYGSDWRTPLPGWSHNFDPTPYSDWFWPTE